MSGPQIAMRAVISGRVQGVGFRYACFREVQRVRESAVLTGWVRNRSDGSVEVFAQGDGSAVLALLEWCKRGPKRAEIERVEEFRAEIDSKLTNFEIV